MVDNTADIKKYINIEIATLKKVDVALINTLMNTLEFAWQRNATIYIMGNGGSAATASHYANDFNKGISEHIEYPFKFICLNENISTVMAIANDICYDAIFEFQLRGKVKKDDLVIGISGSGNSPNVLKAIELAKTIGAMTIGLTGYDGGMLAKIVDLSINVPVMSMQITEDVHMILNHLMMAVFYKTLCGIDHIKVK